MGSELRWPILRPVAELADIPGEAGRPDPNSAEIRRQEPYAIGMDVQPIRVAVLISGSGTTLQNFLDQIEAGRLPARVVLVVSNSADAFGLERARKANIATLVVSRKEAGAREEFSRRIFAACRDAKADLVCMAGFLQLIDVPEDFLGRVMNIHPALIPAFCGKGFYGRRVHEAVLDYGAKLSGCTVHFADNEYDHGPIILQRAVPVLNDDTPESLAARVFVAECEAYPEAIRLFAEGKLTLAGRRVRIAHAGV
jgi:formyltetrahydrofolate-dependent phosphoribosylglycinamide formyltransferase